jgi:hypothetical protein
MNLPPNSDIQRSTFVRKEVIRGGTETYCISFSALLIPNPFQKSSKVPSSGGCSLALHAHFGPLFPPLELGEYVYVLTTFWYVLPCFQLAEAARISFPAAIIASSEGISDGLMGSPLRRKLDCAWDMDILIVAFQRVGDIGFVMAGKAQHVLSTPQHVA